MCPVTAPARRPSSNDSAECADADPAQHRLAEAGEVDDALDEERLDLGHGAAGGQDERVEREARVEPGAEDRDAAAAGERVEPVGDRRRRSPTDTRPPRRS